MCSSSTPMWSHHTHHPSTNWVITCLAWCCRALWLASCWSSGHTRWDRFGWDGVGLNHGFRNVIISSHVQFKIAKVLVLSRFAPDYSSIDSSATLPPILDRVVLIWISLLTTPVLLVLLLCIPSQPPVSWEEFEYFEFYAGVGNLCRQARACGYKALRFDILDNVRPHDRKTNFMDINSPSGFAFLVGICIHIGFDLFFTELGSFTNSKGPHI